MEDTKQETSLKEMESIVSGLERQDRVNLTEYWWVTETLAMIANVFVSDSVEMLGHDFRTAARRLGVKGHEGKC